MESRFVLSEAEYTNYHLSLQYYTTNLWIFQVLSHQITPKAYQFAHSATSLGVSPHHCEAHHLHGVQHHAFVPRAAE